MQNEIIRLVEPTPKLHSTKCKIVAFFIKIFLQYTTAGIGLLAWYIYDYFIALLGLILSFIVMGIIRSTLRNSSLPLNQKEYHYSDEAIARWYAKDICFEKIEKEQLK